MKKRILVVWRTTRGNLEQWKERRGFFEECHRSIAGSDTIFDEYKTKMIHM